MNRSVVLGIVVTIALVTAVPATFALMSASSREAGAHRLPAAAGAGQADPAPAGDGTTATDGHGVLSTARQPVESGVSSSPAPGATISTLPPHAPELASPAPTATAGLPTAGLPTAGLLPSPLPSSSPDPLPTVLPSRPWTTPSASSPAGTGSAGTGSAGTVPAVTPSSAAGGPSGAAVPTGNVAGWTLTYTQDFNGTSLPADWGAYSGTPGGESSSVAQWTPSMCSVSGGLLHFHASGIDSCGIGSWVNPQTYGMYLVRMKGDNDGGMNFSDIALLWPANGQWPPEIDFFEDDGGSRDNYAATVHPGGNGNNSGQIQVGVNNDATQWHTYGVQWTPDTITYTVDGRQVGVAHKSGSWPNIPMILDLQSQNLAGRGSSGTIETMTVDWIAEYSYTPGSI